MSLAGAIADARKSAQRMYINNFADKGRQNTIDMLLVSSTALEKPFTYTRTGTAHGAIAGTFVRSNQRLCSQ